jgi:hypothetical protein
LIALAVSPFIYRRIIGRDSFLPLPIKIFSATTEKKDRSRMKLKLKNRMMYFWRHKNGDVGGKSGVNQWSAQAGFACHAPTGWITRGRDRAGTPDCPV